VGDVYFGYFLKITKLAKKIFVYFFQDKCYVSIWTKSGWATFWAIFSQTHLVTLVKNGSVAGSAVERGGHGRPRCVPSDMRIRMKEDGLVRDLGQALRLPAVVDHQQRMIEP
jgi:hypothetical protein